MMKGKNCIFLTITYEYAISYKNSRHSCLTLLYRMAIKSGNIDNIITMLSDQLMSALDGLGEGHPEWFQQDDAPPHYARVVRDWLDDNFQTWIGRRGRVEWVWVSRLCFQTLWPLCRVIVGTVDWFQCVSVCYVRTCRFSIYFHNSSSRNRHVSSPNRDTDYSELFRVFPQSLHRMLPNTLKSLSTDSYPVHSTAHVLSQLIWIQVVYAVDRASWNSLQSNQPTTKGEILANMTECWWSLFMALYSRFEKSHLCWNRIRDSDGWKQAKHSNITKCWEY
jgi:hypothetical protein